jgi:hypothetical protein
MQSINNIEKRALALELTSELAEQMRTICEDERERVRRSGRPRKEKQEKPVEMKDIFKTDIDEMKAMAGEDKRSHKVEKYEDKKAKEEAKQAKEAEKKAKEEAKQAKEAEKKAKEEAKQAKAQIKKDKEEAKKQKLLEQLRKLEEPKPKKSPKKSPKKNLKLSLEIPTEPMTPSTEVNSNRSSQDSVFGDFGISAEDVSEGLEIQEEALKRLDMPDENILEAALERVQKANEEKSKKAEKKTKTEKKKLGKNSIPYIECEGGSYILRNNYIYSNTQLLGKLTEGVPTFYGSKLEPDEDDDDFKVVKIEFKNITIATATSRQLVESRSCMIDINCCLYDGDCDKIGKYCPLTDIITLCEEEEVDYDSYEDNDE